MYTLDAYWGGDVCRLPCTPIWRRKWQPTPVFLPGEFHGWRGLVGYNPWGHKESDTTEWLTLVLLSKSSAVRDGYVFPGVWRGYMVSALLSLKICHPGSQPWVFFVNEERGQQTILPTYQVKVAGTKWVPSNLSHSEPQKVIWGTLCLNPSKRIPNVIPYAQESSSFISHMGCNAAVGIAISWPWKSVPEGSQIGVVSRMVWGGLWS